MYFRYNKTIKFRNADQVCREQPSPLDGATRNGDFYCVSIERACIFHFHLDLTV